MKGLILKVRERGLQDALALVEKTLANPDLEERSRDQWLGAKKYLQKDLEVLEAQILEPENPLVVEVEAALPKLTVNVSVNREATGDLEAEFREVWKLNGVRWSD